MLIPILHDICKLLLSNTRGIETTSIIFFAKFFKDSLLEKSSIIIANSSPQYEQMYRNEPIHTVFFLFTYGLHF